MLRRVTLEFPTDAQVRYLERVPEPGDRINGLAGDSFLVSAVEADGAGFHVTCVREPSRPPRPKATHAPYLARSPNQSDTL
jgi:hypothetical protein